MYFRNVDYRILRLLNVEVFGRAILLPADSEGCCDDDDDDDGCDG